MSMQVTITLPDHIARRVNQWASFAQQDVSEMLTTAIDVGLPQLSGIRQESITELGDEALLELTTTKLDREKGSRLDSLLVKQREGALTDSERPELLVLMQQYHELWVLQAQALAESVRRGLLPPMAA